MSVNGRKMYLVLQNGTVFDGYSFGAERESIGEVVFTTAMTGYNETLTDKSYYGQIITQAFPLIGNYGIIKEDFEGSGISAFGYIVSEACETPSNFRCGGDLDALLKEQNVPGICGVDTRALVRTVRENGVMNGKISFTPDFDDAITGYTVKNAVKNVSVTEKIPGGEGKYRVALLDYGYKENIRRELIKRGCSVTVFPFDTAAGEITAFAPDGLMLSNGPGDPAENTGCVSVLKELTQTGIPIFGICLGHQLLAIANGFPTGKLKFGHRGTNQPAKELDTGRTYMTSQNHGYAVLTDGADTNIAEPLFVNVNDGTNEGLIYKTSDAFSVQFHPEACGGPRDTGFLFDRFISRMEAHMNA